MGIYYSNFHCWFDLDGKPVEKKSNTIYVDFKNKCRLKLSEKEPKYQEVIDMIKIIRKNGVVIQI